MSCNFYTRNLTTLDYPETYEAFSELFDNAIKEDTSCVPLFVLEQSVDQLEDTKQYLFASIADKRKNGVKA